MSNCERGAQSLIYISPCFKNQILKIVRKIINHIKEKMEGKASREGRQHMDAKGPRQELHGQI